MRLQCDRAAISAPLTHYMRVNSNISKTYHMLKILTFNSKCFLSFLAVPFFTNPIVKDIIKDSKRIKWEKKFLVPIFGDSNERN